ncbi:hypothetical protein ACJU26_09055 [Acidithiobacillus sp. M4-SHS-6]|uniref:hypothetical protein n=1 Tax=Acidithiobacillus sp. M4-SHS-6 TaxID=3383024 RepID=UPI0039BE7B97
MFSNRIPMAVISAALVWFPAVSLAGVVAPPLPPMDDALRPPAVSGMPPKNTPTALLAPASGAGPQVTAKVSGNGVPAQLLEARNQMTRGNGLNPEQLRTTPAKTGKLTRQQRILAQEAAQVWAHARTSTPAQHFEPAHHHPISRRIRNEKRVARFEKAWQGRVYTVPAGGFYVTIEASAPILHVIIPPSKQRIDGRFSYLARGKFLPDTGNKDLMLRFHRAAAYHPIELTIEFAGGLRILYLVPKPLPIGKTIHVKAPKYTPPAKPLKYPVSGNPASRFLPAIRAVWEHAAHIPGFVAANPPRHAVNYGRLLLVPVAGYQSSSANTWMILWRVQSLHGKTSNISPAQFSGNGIDAVSLTGTRVSPTSSPYMLTVETGLAHG